MSARIAMIGAGGVPPGTCGCCPASAPGWSAVADPVPAAAQRLAADCGATAYPDAERLLDAERVDAAYVCVPPFAHGAPERAVLARRLPLFVEKPLACDLATATGLAALVAERRAWSPAPATTGAAWTPSSGPGSCSPTDPVRLAAGAWLDKVPPPPWWTDRDRSGGQVVEQLTHVLDLAGCWSATSARCTRTAPAARTPPATWTTSPPSPPGTAPARSARSPPARCCRPSAAPAWRRCRPAGCCSTCPSRSWWSSGPARSRRC